MKYLKYLLGVIVLLAIIFFGRGILTPEITYTSEVTVNKSAKEVWAVMNDPSKLPQWIEGFKRTELVSGTANTVGAVSKNYVEDNGQEMTMTETITAIRPQEHIAMNFELDGMGMNMDYKVDIDEKDGKTTLRSNTVTKGEGLLMKSMISFMSGSMQAQEDKNMANLKKVIEENTTDYFPETVVENVEEVVEQ